MFSSEWFITSLPNCIDPNPIYLPLFKSPQVVHDAIFYERPPTKVRKVKGMDIVLDPYQMVLSEMNLDLKKWETILSKNAISLSGNKDHLNRMESVIKNDFMVIPYGMLLTRLYRHVLTTQPIDISDIHLLADHVMVPLTEEHAH
ncbi:hypothetical protein Tco_1257707, partial [Tanacetum coccineum]